MGGVVLSRSLIQFSVDGWDVPSLLFTWGQTMVEVMEIMVTSFKRRWPPPYIYCYTQCPQPCSSPPPSHPPLETPGYSWASLGWSPVGSLLLYPGSWCTQGCVCALWVSPAGMGFDSKSEFAPPTVLLGLLPIPYDYTVEEINRFKE